MSTNDAMSLLIDLASRATDSRMRDLAGALARERAESERLRLLTDYRATYHQRLERAQREGINRALLQGYRQFIERLDGAIVQQTLMIEHRAADTTRARDDLSEAERRRKSLETVQARRARTQRLLIERREQKPHDEFATRASAAGAGFNDD